MNPLGIFDWVMDIVGFIYQRIMTAIGDIFIGLKDVSKVRQEEQVFGKVTAIFEKKGVISMLNSTVTKDDRYIKPNILNRIWINDKSLNSGGVFVCPANYPKTVSIEEIIHQLGKDKDINGNNCEDWTIDTARVLDSKFFLFLDEVPKRRLYTMMLLSFVAGAFVCLLIINYVMFKIL